jgi:hypothetical protein
MRVYMAKARRYEAEQERNAAVLEARRAMGAAPPKNMMKKPRQPQLMLVRLFRRDCVRLVREGEGEKERAMRKELACLDEGISSFYPQFSFIWRIRIGTTNESDE